MPLPLLIRLNLPLPWELGQINTYLVRDGSGWMLVDCGMDTPESVAALEAQLEQAGIGWAEIHTILLTHIHPDHMGLAPKLLERTGARLLMHRVEKEHLDHVVAAISNGRDSDGAFVLAGTPPDYAAKVREAMRDVETAFVPLRPEVLLQGGERIGHATVIHTPGHSPGHVCLKLDDGSLISGDHLLETITPNISWMPGRDCLGEFLEALDGIAKLDIGTVYPAHGEPFIGHRDWIRQTAAHHRERCDEIATALRIHPRTAHEMVAVLWPRRLSPFHYRFGVYEALAHLEYMRRRSQVVLGDGGRWSST